MSIPASQARAIFTQMVTDVYRERPTATGFVRSFFPGKQASTKYVSVEVERGDEKVAVDVVRGADGNRNSFGRSTEKIFEPPYFREYFELTELDLYDRMIGSENISESVLADFASSVSDKLGLMQAKIDRKYELMCAQALIDGIITLKNGDNIDFKRKAGSLVDLTGSAWTNDANNPLDHLKNGAEFIRKNGKAQGGVYNVIMGESALTAFLGNSNVQTRADIRNFNLDAINAPQRNSVGGTYHGRVTGGSYLFDIWTYPEFYKNDAGVLVPYITDEKIVILPQSPRFHLAYAAVPRLIGGSDITAQSYVFGEYMDEKNTSHIMDIKSAGVPIPVAIDQIYTAEVVA